MKTAITFANRSGRFVLLLAFYVWYIAGAAAQQSPVPASYQLDSLADFKKYESKVIPCIAWHAETPRSSSVANERKKAEDFLISWISGCPYINVIIEPYVMKLSSKNADLVVSFMFGYTRFALQNPKNKDLVLANVAGLDHLLNDYRLNLKSLKKDPDIDQLLALQKTAGLPAWVEPRLKQKKLD